MTLPLWDVSRAAKVACVKSRDMHWALVAHRDQRDVNLSSLRLLVVADGSNPCKSCSSTSPRCSSSLRAPERCFSLSSLTFRVHLILRRLPQCLPV